MIYLWKKTPSNVKSYLLDQGGYCDNRHWEINSHANGKKFLFNNTLPLLLSFL